MKTIAADPAEDDAVAATMDLRRVSKDAEISGSRGRLFGTVIIYGGYIIWIHLRNPRQVGPRAERASVLPMSSQSYTARRRVFVLSLHSEVLRLHWGMLWPSHFYSTLLEDKRRCMNRRGILSFHRSSKSRDAKNNTLITQ